VPYCLARNCIVFDKYSSGFKYLEKFLDRLRALQSPEKGSAPWNGTFALAFRDEVVMGYVIQN
jgi:hypothetical protein